MSFRSSLKEVFVNTGLYRPIRRFYHRLVPNEVGRDHRRQVEFYSQFVSPGDLCFDVGANIGAKSEVFLDLGARVVSFEPQPECVRELQARCGPNPRLTVVAAAVGERVGEATLFIGKTNAMSSLLSDSRNKTGQELKVPVVTLDSMIAKYGVPHFCKIDVEGLELAVLHGLSQPIPIVSLEYHLESRDNEKTLACLHRLAEWGTLSLNLTHGENPNLAWPEWVSLEQFTRDFPDRAPRSATCSYGDILIRTLGTGQANGSIETSRPK